MLDNLRNQTSFQPEEEESYSTGSFNKPKPAKRRGRTFDQITGTTGLQRFVLSAMLFVMVLLLGILFLFVMGKIVLPISF